MKLNKTVLAILALFVVIMGATAVSAIDDTCDVVAADEADDGDANPTEVTTTGDESDDNPYHNGEKTPNEKAIDEEAENADLDVGDNPYRHGEKTPNEKAFDEEADNLKAAGSDDAPQSSSTQVGSSATGNPLAVLLAAMVIIGTGFVRSRK